MGITEEHVVILKINMHVIQGGVSFKPISHKPHNWNLSFLHEQSDFMNNTNTV